VSQQSSPSWSQVKAKLAGFSQQELLDIIRDLYKLNPDNKVFLSSHLQIGDTRDLSEPYRRIIRKVFNPDRGFPSLNLKAARKALNDFKKANADPGAVADLMVYYVEQGVQCTLQYGDIHEGFYSGLESVYSDAIALITKTGDAEIIAEFYPRLEQIVWDTSPVGWGFHDYLDDIFYSNYPQGFG
jgi:hypothetical protein